MTAHATVHYDASRLTDHDIYLFKQGRHYKLYEKLGAHVMQRGGEQGVHFAVWAPNAREVSVKGDFNGWNGATHYLACREDGSGIWEGFIPGLGVGEKYKYHIHSNHHGYRVDKADPFAFATERPPHTASVVADLSYQWNDGEWMAGRGHNNRLDGPMSVYEVHLGSWRKGPGGVYQSYDDLAEQLAGHMEYTGFTHVELMPVQEHPFYGSWGYQSTGYFAPTSRFGSPQGFMRLVEALHQRGVGVILDWVPSHFPTDEHGLGYFDGTHLFEHSDPREGFHPDWNSYIFNYGRWEVRSFLISSALFWLETYHLDGLRLDAVASMLYRDYSRGDDWIPNQYGGRENLEAIEFLRSLNHAVYENFPDVQTIAEESTAYPMVSRPTYVGGLGFGLKWNMGWMNDTLDYFSKEPVYRKHHHNQLTFSIWYAFHENFMLSLSHDEVVHGKGSLLSKMPGDGWQKFANLRLLLGYMWTHPGKKLLFMGQEFGQGPEWDHEQGLLWDQLDMEPHQKLQLWVADLNKLYRHSPELYEQDFDNKGFKWVDFGDWEQSVVSYLRIDKAGHELLVVMNATPVPRGGYRIGVPRTGFWKEALNSDSEIYGGSGWGNYGGKTAEALPAHGYDHSILLDIPPLGLLVLRPEDRTERPKEETRRFIFPTPLPSGRDEA
ncbi:MAG: 1,4-alpha-glucan branching protein GlgB [Okeania sp. SIO3B3]|nr:1,4-alpha-glucan branching protein GlgB [Okeania sp. SIO3B3]